MPFLALKCLYLIALVRITWQMQTISIWAPHCPISLSPLSEEGHRVLSFTKSIQKWRLVDYELPVMVERLYRALWSNWRSVAPCSPGSFGPLRNNGLIEDLQQTPDTVAWPGRALLFKRQKKRKAIFCLLSLYIASCAPGSDVTLFMAQNHSYPLYRTVIMCMAFRPQWPTGTEKSLTSLIKRIH